MATFLLLQPVKRIKFSTTIKSKYKFFKTHDHLLKNKSWINNLNAYRK